MKAIIKTKVAGYNGVAACVPFVNGEAEAEISESQLAYFKKAGYTVKVVKPDPETGDAKANKTGDKAGRQAEDKAKDGEGDKGEGSEGSDPEADATKGER